MTVMVDNTIDSYQKERSLFSQGGFTSHSGLDLDWKINCDALSGESIRCIAKKIARHQVFCEVYGIPTGGDRLAEALKPYVMKAGHNVLIVDDVLTTGKSMEEAKKLFGTRYCQGVVLFSRMSPEKVPSWINPVFQLGDLYVVDGKV